MATPEVEIVFRKKFETTDDPMDASPKDCWNGEDAASTTDGMEGLNADDCTC